LSEARERGSATLDRLEIMRQAARLDQAGPLEVLSWADEVFEERLTLSVSFGGAEGMVLLDMLSCVTDRATVFTLDTGFLFEETIRLCEEAMRRYPLRTVVVRPELSVEEQVERYGPQMKTCTPDLCCQVRKVEPQKRFLEGYDAWVTGIRRDQTDERSRTPVVEWDDFFGVVKLAPLARWSADEVQEYARENGVPLNPLLSRGYRSIGCWPQTRPVDEGEDARAGRWSDSDKTECGIHVVNGKVRRAVP
jgi:phosphoadenosine phosphosulfate reductase